MTTSRTRRRRPAVLPAGRPAAGPTAPGALTRAATALVGLVLFAAVPLVLHAWRPDPLPHTFQPGRWISLARAGYLHPDVIPNSLAVLAWLVWLLLAAALLREVAAQLRRGGAAARTRLLPGVVQRLASTWITSLPLLLALAAGRLNAAPLPAAVTAATSTPTLPPTSPDSAPKAAGPDTAAFTVTHTHAGPYDIHRSERYDTLRSLAAQHYGSADLWWIIRDASVGVVQPDGSSLPAGFVAVDPGTILHIPSAPLADVSYALAADREPAGPATQPRAGNHEVLPGENLWTIVDAAYRDLSPLDVRAAVDSVFAANHGVTDQHGHVLTSPQLINPGMRLRLPVLPPNPELPSSPEAGRPAAPSSTTATAPSAPSAPRIAATPTALTTPEPPVSSSSASAAAPTPTSQPTPLEPAQAPALPPSPTPPSPALTTAAGQQLVTPNLSPTHTPAMPTTPTTPHSPHDRTTESLTWLAAAGLLATTIVGSWTARRRRRDNHTTPRHIVPPAPPDQAELHAALLEADDPDRLDRIDAALRHLALTHLGQPTGPHPQVLLVHPDDTVEIYLHPNGTHDLPAPWEAGPDPLIWALPADAVLPPLTDLPPPCPALVQLGATLDGADVLADLEALGSLAIHADTDRLRATTRAILATLISSPWANLTRIHTLGLDSHAVTDPERVTADDTADTLLAAAQHDSDLLQHTLDAGGYPTTLTARINEPGEEFDPLIALLVTDSGSNGSSDVEAGPVHDLVDLSGDGLRGLGVLLPADTAITTRWVLRPTPTEENPDLWRLQPLGLPFVLTGLPADTSDTLAELWADAAAPLPEVPLPPAAPDPHPFTEPPWQVMVRLLGPVDVTARDGTHADPATTRERTNEVLAWLITHRRGTRTDLESALWPRGATPKTIANALSRVRRLLTTLAGDDAEHWLPRFERTALTLAPQVTSDLDLLEARIHHAEQHRNHPETAIPVLKEAVDLILGIPAGYPWLDAHMGSILTTTPIKAVILLAQHHLEHGDTAAALATTIRGLEILPAHTELFALRLRAHALNHDPNALRAEYRAYLRAEQAEPYWDGDTDRDLETLHQRLLHDIALHSKLPLERSRFCRQS
ncbi:bacterial transcriptional activator domain-containing protein [Frankia sp. Ag45/Mut15]|uniref:Bacterial transcriptional activator domain-containing protein n=1 Tax=Frankia umida TaxID=573489 RepID=A0ABT0K3K1_9ACTN|nr:bacterial transcriptional activator domain-containing protein [Frankia umida]MCK9878302.1 bacterial transcriptional activator domain-containing protein [Frankia umida]